MTDSAAPLHTMTETETNYFIYSGFYLKVFWQRQSLRKTHHSLFSPIVSSLTISTTSANKLPLLQAALVAIFQEVEYISWLF